MASKWPVVELGELAAGEAGAVAIGPFGSRMKANVYSEDGVPVIRGTNISTGRWLEGDWVYIPYEFAAGLENCLLKPGDLTFPHRGAIGEVAIVCPEHGVLMLSTSMMKFRPDSTKADSGYLFYYFRSHVGRSEILKFTSQVGTPGIGQPLSSLRQFKVLLPPVKVQKQIASVLGSLDDKIELNRRMNRTLEKMAAAIFKSWFIDFDPVHAKAEGRDPNLPDEIADLFPDGFEESDLGSIPEGWQVTAVEEVAEIVKGRSYKSAELQPSDVALVTLKSFLRGGGYREDGLKPYTGKYKPEQVVQPGEIVVAMTDVTQNAEVIGRPAIVMPDARHGVLVASLDTSVVRPTSDTVSTPFLYGLFSTEAFRAHTYAHSSGTTVLHLAKNAIPSFEFPCPTEQVQRAFLSLVGPLRSRQQTMHRQNRRLAGLRDTLLPKLLSGEIELPEAEAVAEEVVSS